MLHSRKVCEQSILDAALVLCGCRNSIPTDHYGKITIVSQKNKDGPRPPQQPACIEELMCPASWLNYPVGYNVYVLQDSLQIPLPKSHKTHTAGRTRPDASHQIHEVTGSVPAHGAHTAKSAKIVVGRRWIKPSTIDAM